MIIADVSVIVATAVAAQIMYAAEDGTGAFMTYGVKDILLMEGHFHFVNSTMEDFNSKEFCFTS